jgi:hypothetical protein
LLLKLPIFGFSGELDYFHIATDINKLTTHMNQLTNKKEITTLGTVGMIYINNN